MIGNKFMGGLFGGNKKPETSEDLKKKSAAALAEAERLKLLQEKTDEEEARELDRLQKQIEAKKAQLAGKKGTYHEKEQKKKTEATEIAAAAQQQLLKETMQSAKHELDNATRDVHALAAQKREIEHMIEQLKGQLKTNEKDTVDANAHLEIARKVYDRAREVYEGAPNSNVANAMPIGGLERKSSEDRKSSESRASRSSSTTERKSDLSHTSTTGMPKPPPIPQRPVIIEGLGTVFTDRDGRQQLAFKGHPDEKVDIMIDVDKKITKDTDYIAVIINGVDYGFTKEADSDKWNAFAMNNDGQWEAIENNFVEEPKRSRGPSMGSVHSDPEDLL